MSLENPNVPLNWRDPDEDTYNALGATRSSAGVSVTTQSALGYPAVWRAVNLISGDVAKLPLLTYRLDHKPDGTRANRTVDRTHPSYRILRYKAHDDLLAYHLKQVLTFHALCKGNGYAYIDRRGPRPSRLLILAPERMAPLMVSGRLWYVYKVPGGGEDRKLPAADILHIRGLGYDGLEGYPVLSLMRDSLGAAIAARDHAGKYFANNAKPGAVLMTEKALKVEARRNMRESWERLHKGLTNAHKIAILEEGTKLQELTGGDAESAQLLQNREFDAREVANIFGVPTHKLGDPSKVAYNSLGEENQSYLDDTLSRWLQLWSDECSDKLLSEDEKAAESHLIDFDYRILARANLAAKTAYATAAVAGGWETTDEIRELFDKNPMPGEEGDAPAPAPDPEPVAEAGPTDAERAAALRPLLVDTARRLARRLADGAHKARGGTFEEWAPTMRPAVLAAVEPVAPAVRLALPSHVPEGDGMANNLEWEIGLSIRSAWPDRIQAGADELAAMVAERWADRFLGVAA